MEYIVIQSRYACTCIVDETDTFESLTAQYKDAWRDADIEKRRTGKISRKTHKRLERLSNALNKAERC